MGKNGYLGEFELLVMATLARLGDDAYGMAIRREIEARTDRSVSIGNVYAALRRLQAKGYVATRMGEPTAERGGRAKKLFRLEAEGAAAIKRARAQFDVLWKGAKAHPGLRG